MDEIILYLARDGVAFESDRLCKSYEKLLDEYKEKYAGKAKRPSVYDFVTKEKKREYKKILCTVYGNIPPLRSTIKRISFFRAGFVSTTGVFLSTNFISPVDAMEYETKSKDISANWKDYIIENAPEDLFNEYDETLLSELKSYGWIMWDDEKPRPNMELMLFERKGSACSICYDTYIGAGFEKSYHLDIIGWKYRQEKDPPSDAWEEFQKRKQLKKTDFTIYRKV